MSKDAWRDNDGFGRAVDCGHGTWEQYGPDEEPHALGCEFIRERGILPCSCDATRKRFAKDENGERTVWFARWLRWQYVRCSMWRRHGERVKWPVTGPDGDPWVPGYDFNDELQGKLA